MRSLPADYFDDPPAPASRQRLDFLADQLRELFPFIVSYHPHDDRLGLRTPYDPAILVEIKRIPEIRWDPVAKAWHAPVVTLWQHRKQLRAIALLMGWRWLSDDDAPLD